MRIDVKPNWLIVFSPLSLLIFYLDFYLLLRVGVLKSPTVTFF